jgi:hypothetical protein
VSPDLEHIAIGTCHTNTTGLPKLSAVKVEIIAPVAVGGDR